MRSPIKLEQLHIAEPCPADWNAMAGDDRTRFCEVCHKHVYDLSARSRAEGETLLAASDGRLCVQFARRPDGTVVTRDGWRRFKLVRRFAAAASLTMAFVATLTGCRRDAGSTHLTGTPLPGAVDPIATQLVGRIADPTGRATSKPSTMPTMMGDVGPAIRGEAASPSMTSPATAPASD